MVTSVNEIQKEPWKLRRRLRHTKEHVMDCGVRHMLKKLQRLWRVFSIYLDSFRMHFVVIVRGIPSKLAFVLFVGIL